MKSMLVFKGMAVEERWCVVTGGRGFAARHLVEMLIRYEMFFVRIADLGSKIELEPHEDEGILGQALRSGRAQYVSTNLCDKSQVIKGCLLLVYFSTICMIIAAIMMSWF